MIKSAVIFRSRSCQQIFTRKKTENSIDRLSHGGLLNAFQPSNKSQMESSQGIEIFSNPWNQKMKGRARTIRTETCDKSILAKLYAIYRLSNSVSYCLEENKEIEQKSTFTFPTRISVNNIIITDPQENTTTFSHYLAKQSNNPNLSTE